MRVSFKYENQVLEGELLSAKTLPAFVEIIIEKSPSPKKMTPEHHVDYYNRYYVPVEDLVGLVDEQEVKY